MRKVFGGLAVIAISGCASAAGTSDDGDVADACATCGGDDIREAADAAPADSDTDADTTPATPPCTPSDWQLEPIDAWSETVVISPTHPSLRLSDDGAVDVAYLTEPYQGGPRRFAHRAPAGGWSIDELPGVADGNLAEIVAPDGTEHTCFTERTDNGRQLVCTARAPGGPLESVVVDDSTSLGLVPAIAPDGTLYLSYGDIEGVGLAVRSPTGAWTIAPLGLRWGGPMVVDAAGCLHTVALAAPPSTAIEHSVRCGGPAWTTEVAVATAVEPRLSIESFQLDGAGALHVLYTDRVEGPDHHPFYARRATDGTWSALELSDYTGIYADSMSLAVAPDGVAHAIVLGLAPGDPAGRFYHLRLDGAPAAPAPFGPVAEVGSTDLAIDAAGTLHVVLDHGAKQLDYARACDPHQP